MILLNYLLTLGEFGREDSWIPSQCPINTPRLFGSGVTPVDSLPESAQPELSGARAWALMMDMSFNKTGVRLGD